MDLDFMKQLIGVLVVVSFIVVTIGVCEAIKGQTTEVQSGNLILNPSFEDFPVGEVRSDWIYNPSFELDENYSSDGVNWSSENIEVIYPTDIDAFDGTKSMFVNTSGSSDIYLDYSNGTIDNTLIPDSAEYNLTFVIKPVNLTVNLEDCWDYVQTGSTCGYSSGASSDYEIIFNSTDVINPNPPEDYPYMKNVTMTDLYDGWKEIKIELVGYHYNRQMKQIAIGMTGQDASGDFEAYYLLDNVTITTYYPVVYLDECDYSDGKEWCMDSLTLGNGVDTNNPVIVFGNSSQGTKSAMLNVSGTGLNFLGYISPEISFIEPDKTYSVSLDFYTPNISVDFWLGFYNGTTPDVNSIIFNSTDVNGDVGSGIVTAINSTWNRLYFSWDNGDNPNSNYGNNLVIGCNACDDPVGQVAYVDNFDFKGEVIVPLMDFNTSVMITIIEIFVGVIGLIIFLKIMEV